MSAGTPLGRFGLVRGARRGIAICRLAGAAPGHQPHIVAAESSVQPLTAIPGSGDSQRPLRYQLEEVEQTSLCVTSKAGGHLRYRVADNVRVCHMT